MFLLYTKDSEEGRARGIYRDGIGSPWMWDEDAQRRITDPEEQRRGTWLIDSGIAKCLEKEAINRKRDVPEVRRRLQEVFKTDPDLVLNDWIAELDTTPDYFSTFGKMYHDYKVVGMQGCGNLTMNRWFVGYTNSKFTEDRPVFLYRRDEPFEGLHVYTCLVKDKQNKSLAIDNVRFNMYKRRIYKVFPDGHEDDITDTAEFAVFGQQLVKKGELVPFSGIVTQFEDIRHLFKLPNINPKAELPGVKQSRRPRMLFGDDRADDVWFGERELIDPSKNDLLRHGLTEPILLDRDFSVMGAGWDLIRAAFKESTGGGYRELSGEHAEFPPRNRGEWRKYTDSQIEIYLQRNVYAYTMIGINTDGNVVAAAAGGLAGKVGHTLEAMAQNMVSMGATDVLLIDEGNDVFQRLEDDYVVRPIRGRIRAVFVFACRSVSSSKAESQL
jgi:hypothetical protein